MDDENHRVHFDVRANNYEFGMQSSSHMCPPSCQRQLTLGADDETQTAPGRRLRRSIQFTAVQVASLLDILLNRLRGLPRSLYRSVPGIPE